MSRTPNKDGKHSAQGIQSALVRGLAELEYGIWK